jgi:hypothetical protein
MTKHNGATAAARTQAELRMRILLVAPPPGVAFALQHGPHGLVGPVAERQGAQVFEFTVRVGDASVEPPRLLGPFTQGPAAARFVYICVGTSAGQFGSPWTRRIKVPLYTMAPGLVAEALALPHAVLESRIAGTGRDGSPACATVSLLSPWAIAAS